jgi:hypothetical protein
VTERVASVKIVDSVVGSSVWNSFDSFGLGTESTLSLTWNSFVFVQSTLLLAWNSFYFVQSTLSLARWFGTVLTLLGLGQSRLCRLLGTVLTLSSRLCRWLGTVLTLSSRLCRWLVGLEQF